VIVAEDGQEALDKVQKSMDPNSPHFDVVFMDIQMPNMDGIESTKRIRELGFSAPIIALTAFADESNREACMNAGMNAFLGKPIKRPSLKQVLEEFGGAYIGRGE
jgi:osomolarity two-component system sensor histidine kinase SLN1